MIYLPYAMLFVILVTVAGVVWLLGRLENNESTANQGPLRFAAATMTGVLLVFLFSMSIYAAEPADTVGSSGKEIFDGCLKALPPIVTLVLGFWFGSKSNSN
ncbi:MAG: hypothetical protein SFX18_17610 [Pirellulales bacterium]|nr:hypothetical protein [Pirellulales bacterium]